MPLGQINRALQILVSILFRWGPDAFGEGPCKQYFKEGPCEQLLTLLTLKSTTDFQARSQGRGVRWVRRTPQISQKGPLLATKWTKNGVFVGG